MATETDIPGTTSGDPAGKLDAAKAKVGDAVEAARETIGGALGTVTEGVTSAYSATAERTGAAYEAARAKASVATQTAGRGLEENPLAALLGGLAVGVLAGALLPRTEREAQLLGPVGSRLQDAAREALKAGKEAGRGKLDELGLNADSARDTVQKLLDNAVAAAAAAASASVKAARGHSGA